MSTPDVEDETPVSRWAANAVLLLISASVALVAAELALRKLRPQVARMFRFHERTIYELTPSTSRSFTHLEGNGGHTVLTRINSAGYRGAELEASPERRIVVYGDSSIQAEFTAREATFAARLGDRLDRGCPWHTEVVNAGIVGYGPDQILRKLEAELPVLEPDLVIVAIFADNDLGDLLRNKIFELSPDGELRENPLRLTRSLERSLGVRRDLALVRLAKKAYWRWLAWRQSRTVDAGARETSRTGIERVDQWLREAREEYTSYVVEEDRVVRRIDYDHYDADVSLLPDAESSIYKVRLVHRVLARLEALLAEAEVDPLLMIIPSPIDICDGYDFDVDPAKYARYDPPALTRAIEEGARSTGLPTVSLWDSFAAGDPNSLYFHHGDNHWNDRGQDLAARVAAARIAELYWPGCRRE